MGNASVTRTVPRLSSPERVYERAHRPERSVPIANPYPLQPKIYYLKSLVHFDEKSVL